MRGYTVLRLLGIEVRRNAVPPLLPVLALLTWMSPIGRHLVPVALWPDRSTDLQSLIMGVGPAVAGAAAWMASREHRRGMADLLASTPTNRWVRAMVTWGATTAWAALFYATAGAVVFAITATQATWGGPVLWPVLVGFVALVACSAAGFAVGHRFPSRFTAPLAAVGLLLVMSAATSAAIGGAALGLLSPLYPSIGLASAVFYAVRPDLAVVQMVCYLGVAWIALGSMVPFRTARHQLRRTGLALVAAGVVLAGTAIGLVATSHRDAQGVVVPALHDTATDLAIPYTPVCSRTPLKVCVHPAYSRELAVLAEMINRIAAPLAGVPGRPARAEQRAGGEGDVPFHVHGDPAVLTIPHFIIRGTLAPPAFASAVETRVALALVAATTSPERATGAQRALALYLLTQAGNAPNPDLLPVGAVARAAAKRLAALDPATRGSWLHSHLDAVRNGTLSVKDIR
ncbi:MAG: hypothetical protein JWQ95_3720 [Sphaerisporangium sp.]|nr:hypothetical protein [Sphaerisporangium sp.]